MSQFNSELDANETRANFDAMSRSPGALRLANGILKMIRVLVLPEPKSAFDLAELIGEVASEFQADREVQSAQEAEFLLKSVVLAVKRHEKTIESVQNRVESIQNRIEQGLKVAFRFPNDGSSTTLERLAAVVVRGALDFCSNPQEQTNEFLRIASQITESEVRVLGRLYEFQEGMTRQAGHSISQGNWLSNVGNAWFQMNRKYPHDSEEWMNRKSALVRLESYGFIERMQGNPTSEGSELGQSPYALLPLGREFFEYIRPVE